METPVETPEPQPTKSTTITDPVSLARMVAGMVLLEASNLGEINPAMMRRFGERMDQVFNNAVNGWQLSWGVKGNIVMIPPTPAPYQPSQAQLIREAIEREQNASVQGKAPE